MTSKQTEKISEKESIEQRLDSILKQALHTEQVRLVRYSRIDESDKGNIFVFTTVYVESDPYIIPSWLDSEFKRFTIQNISVHNNELSITIYADKFIWYITIKKA